jgi:hypothetical protein
LPRQADDSERSNVTPSPELNPLLNPLLGQNMGRWAEVYFTSPPDQREQAVLELLRELRAQDATRGDDATTARANWDQPPAESQAVEGVSRVAAIRCRSCGYENPSHRNYCGMCGTTLDRNETAHAAVWPALIPPESLLPGNDHEISSLQHDLPQFEFSLAGGRKRFYLGGAIALVVLTLGWWAWHGGRASGSNPAPQVSQSRAQQPAGTTPIKPSIVVSDRTTPSTSGSSASPGIVADRPVQSALPTTSTAGTSPQPPVDQGPGSEELAMAKSYLTGTAVHGPDTNQALEWLWKAVSKRNAEAPLVLSDLYLKGEGVPKNCEQARILLEAAARKGTKEATERLQNLHSFGCD